MQENSAAYAAGSECEGLVMNIKYLTSGYIKLFAWSMVLNFVIEALSRHSLIQPALYFSGDLGIFLLNSLIIFLPFTCMFWVRRRVFFTGALSLLWLTAGCMNGFLLSCRTTPFTAADLRLIKYGLNMITTYMNWLQIGSVIAGVVLMTAGLALLWKKAPVSRQWVKREFSCFMTAVCLVLTLGTVRACAQEGVVARHFGNIGQAYEDYGFVYCFSNSLFNVGIPKPDMYDTRVVEKIEEGLVPEGAPSLEKNQKKPNIIMVQLESFFDPQLWKNNPRQEDPIPYFRSLLADYPSGYLSVPSVGAGTANTEFECITGMNLDFFGPGEYPYKTVLNKTVCESVPYDLKKLGYTAHAIHNNEGTFYDRNHVFSQLGFDTFTPIEYMTGIERNPTGWCKDKVLTSQILDTLNSTENPDFVYAISVQGHGAYPDFGYYCEQIREMDDFIKTLTQEAAKLDEPTVIVLYGDHLPGFEWEPEEMENKTLFQTQYVIWNNLNIPDRKTDLESYQLASHVLDLLDIHEGTMIRFHQKFLAGSHGSAESYLEDMEVLEYDILYGDQEVYGGQSPFEATDMRMGIHPIEITEILVQGQEIRLEGVNFNEFSVVHIDGKPLKTEYLENGVLAVRDEKAVKALERRLSLSLARKLKTQSPGGSDRAGSVIPAAASAQDIGGLEAGKSILFQEHQITVRQIGRDKVALGAEAVYQPEGVSQSDGQGFLNHRGGKESSDFVS